MGEGSFCGSSNDITQVAGFVDLQVNGYRGVDFSSIDLTLDRAAHAIRGLLTDGGCCAVLPTLISSPDEVYTHNLPILAQLLESKEFEDRILGFHLEGPFISPEKGAVGCHNPKNVCSPSIEKLNQWQHLARGHVRLITVAAESDNVIDFIKYCTSNNIVVSLGHQLASAEDVDAAVESGARAMTHLGNGLPNLVHRHKNIIWKGLSDDRLSIMIITDGNHLPPNMIRVMFRSKALQSIIVTSDVAPVAGLPDGTYDCFGTTVMVEGNNVRDATGPNLAGSGALMFACIDFLCSESVWPIYCNSAQGSELCNKFQTMKMVGYSNPLRMLGMEEKDMIGRCPMQLLTWKNGKFYYTATMV